MKSNVHNSKRVPLFVAAAILVTSVSTVSPSFAGEQLRSETVKFQDLNVSTPEGAQALYRRIHAAAWRVCSSADPIQQLGASDCAKKAEAKAIETVNAPQLTAVYRVKAGIHTQPLSASR